MELSSLKIEHFSSLFVNLIFNLGEGKKYFDIYCPSIQSKIGNRTCKDCGRYFSTLKFLKVHEKSQRRKIHKPILKWLQNCNQNALLLYQRSKLWLEINYLDMNGLAVPESEDDLSENMPVLPVSRCMENEWCDENF